MQFLLTDNNVYLNIDTIAKIIVHQSDSAHGLFDLEIITKRQEVVNVTNFPYNKLVKIVGHL